MRRLFPMWSHYIMRHSREWPLHYPRFPAGKGFAPSWPPGRAGASDRGIVAGQRARPQRPLDQVATLSEHAYQRGITLPSGQEMIDLCQQASPGRGLGEQRLAEPDSQVTTPAGPQLRQYVEVPLRIRGKQVRLL